jgi:predicted DNA-binding antitoxin AbrB/MazE fold protein
MNLTIQAVYEQGVLRPVVPLSLPEGRTFDVIIAAAEPTVSVLRPATEAEREYARRVNTTRNLDELLAVVSTAPPLPEGYDLSAALNANREATGERPVFSTESDS